MQTLRNNLMTYKLLELCFSLLSQNTKLKGLIISLFYNSSLSSTDYAVKSFKSRMNSVSSIS